MNPEIMERLINILESILDISSDRINDDLTQDTLKIWDSLRHIELVMALEEEFELTFEPEEIEIMGSFKGIKAILAQRLSQ